MGKLYIIDSGFDLKHDLPSRNRSFANYCDNLTLGYLLNNVDSKHFVKLLQLRPNTKWQIDYFDCCDYFRKMRSACDYGIVRRNYEFIRS